MKKVSHEQLQTILTQVPGTLRKLASERDFWREKALAHEQHAEIAKVAHMMQEKSINPELSDEQIFDMLEKAAEQGKLAEISRAVDMVAPDMGQKIASLSESSPSGGATAENRFINSIMGGNG